MARDVEAALSRIEVPDGFTVSLGGELEEQREVFANLLVGVGLALFLVYTVMAVQFESLLQPLIIMTSVPFGLIGVLLALALTGTTFNMNSFLGLIVLVGIVVNNAIVLVDYINLQRREHGMELVDAIVSAGNRRLRPILMTTLTTALGLMPLALGSGRRQRDPDTAGARVVIGGLLTSTAITLVFVPCLYLLIEGPSAAAAPCAAGAGRVRAQAGSDRGGRPGHCLRLASARRAPPEPRGSPSVAGVRKSPVPVSLLSGPTLRLRSNEVAWPRGPERETDTMPTTLCPFRPVLTLLTAGLIASAVLAHSDSRLRVQDPTITVAESAAMALVVVRRNGDEGAVSVDYSTVAVSATEGADFEPSAGTLAWADGDDSDRTVARSRSTTTENERPPRLSSSSLPILRRERSSTSAGSARSSGSPTTTLQEVAATNRESSSSTTPE